MKLTNKRFWKSDRVCNCIYNFFRLKLFGWYYRMEVVKRNNSLAFVCILPMDCTYGKHHYGKNFDFAYEPGRNYNR